LKKGSPGVVRVNQPQDREDTRLYTLISSHLKSSLKGTRAEGVHGVPVQKESTGVVRVNQPLDREDTRLYTLVSSHMI
jgi:hypothetical protein